MMCIIDVVPFGSFYFRFGTVLPVSRSCSQFCTTTRAPSSMPFKKYLTTLASFLASQISSKTRGSLRFMTHTNTLTDTCQQLIELPG